MLTVRWVNQQRKAVGLPPLHKLPGGRGGSATRCRIANAFLDAPNGDTHILDAPLSRVGGRRVAVPFYAAITAAWFDTIGFLFHSTHTPKLTYSWRWRLKEKRAAKKEQKRQKALNTVHASQILNKTDQRVLAIEESIADIKRQLNGLQTSFETTSSNLRTRLRELEQAKKEVDEEIYS